jgi:hypothetical protein
VREREKAREGGRKEREKKQRKERKGKMAPSLQDKRAKLALHV